MQYSGHTPDWPGGAAVERLRSNGKRMFAPAFKAWIVEQAFVPGTSVAGLAMKFGINANQLRRWMTLHRRRGAPALPSVLPVTLAEPAEPAQTHTVRPVVEVRSAVIEIELLGAVVRVPAGADAQHLRFVLQALRS